MPEITRRQMGLALGAASVAIGVGARQAIARPIDLRFPTGFKWGCATAAYQIEGAVQEDGRGESIWDTFSHTEGKTADGQNGDVACDSYHRYAEDTALLKGLGANAYRFSVAWPRIFPQGRGQPNQKGIDHYKRVVDNLLDSGVEPYVTLFHWDLPAALAGGWQSRDTAKAFADYAQFMARQLGDRVKHFMTLNEMRSFVNNGYATGRHAPGMRLSRAEVNQVRHHALLAHGLGVQAIRESGPKGLQVGMAENPIVPVPAIETAQHIAAARKAMHEMNAPYLTALMEGAYPTSFLQAEQAAAPTIEADDMKMIGSPLDFVGLNVYGPIYVRAADTQQGYAVITPPQSFPKMVLPWLMVGPEGLYWAVRFASELWKPRALYISENGCASDDQVVSGRIDDSDRLMFLRNYITQLHRAAAEDFPIRGYFVWSLMDNFEWAEGFTKRFGIHYTDYTTQQRKPKLSATWYRELISKNTVV